METLNQFGKAQKPLHFITFLEKLVAQFKPLQVYQYAQLGNQWQTKSVFCAPQRVHWFEAYNFHFSVLKCHVEGELMEFLKKLEAAYEVLYKKKK